MGLSDEPARELRPDPVVRLEEEDANARRGRPAVVDQHKYRHEIVELLGAGWSPRNLNQMLARLYPDYVPVARSTLLEYRRERIDETMRRPLEAWAAQLRDEHVLLDPIRARAALIVVQEGRVTRALNLEKTLGSSIVLPAIGAEIDRLAKLWDGYEAALARAGFVPTLEGPVPGAVVAQQTNVTVIGALTERAAALPPEQRALLATALERILALRAAARIREVDAKIAASLPAPEGNGSREPGVVTVIELPSLPDGDDARR